MTSATTGAVFFLGNRAHYQTLEPQSALDIENGNDVPNDLTECGWIQCTRSERSDSEVLVLEYHCDEALNHTSGVTHRFRGKRHQDGSNQRILSEESELTPSSLQNVTDRDDVKRKDVSRCAPLRALLSNLRPRRRKTSRERDAQELCTFKDSCRCLDCQSRYFECDESEGDYSMSSDCDDYFNYDCDTPSDIDPPDQSRSPDDSDDEVFDGNPDNVSTDMLIDSPKTSVSSVEEFEGHDLEMAAGTPVVLDYLLNHPIACCVQ